MADARVVFEMRIDTSKIQEVVERVQAAVAKFDRVPSVRRLSDVQALEIPAPGSTWEFADGRDPGAVWKVDSGYRGGDDVLELYRHSDDRLEGDPAQVWSGTVADHNKTFRRSNG
jgi:hypothetical protein